ncbi:DNA ligase D [Stella sp.]|uniref:DNA ligase D n=1 Tax=Stella sp. TaxID=2912054 RepID=UPI0035ADEFF1
MARAAPGPDRLAPYRARRDFSRTREPQGGRAGGGAARFVVQKHDATRLHYDLRLEMDGVFRSWAVTRGPSLVAGEKRLAVQVEDHPLDYGGFEGTIPKGEYGGGTVLVWDRGTWAPEGDPARALGNGHLDFVLEGEKLRGRWHLVRLRGKPREKRENWLLIKSDDEAARPADAPDILEERPDSVATGRGLAEIAAGGDTRPKRRRGDGRAAAPTAGSAAEPMPEFVAPCLAALQPRAPTGRRWLHEIKFDGYRIQVRIAGGRARLRTRSGLDWTDHFGNDLAAALAALPARSALLDGEVVVEGPSGATDFALIQADLAEGRRDRFAIWLFDLLHLDGLDLRRVPLVRRKERLATLLAGADARVRFSEHFDAEGDMMQRHACRLGLEGVVSKLRDSPYRSGRGKDWVKSKCGLRQEFVIGGFVPSSVSRQAVGSLVLGYHDKGRLRHAGRVGTGFDNRTARELFRRLDAIGREASPFAGRLSAEAARGVRFVDPELVAEVEYRGWTADHHLRHASFRGLREDKPAKEVGIEQPEPGRAERPAYRVRLTHPDRVYWPDTGVTKEGLAEYYAEVWPRMAPHVVGRPLALVRCPDGVGRACFFQKHGWRGMPKTIRVGAGPAGGEQLLSIDGLDGAIGLVQSGALEIHPWGAALADIERPDMLTFDLDPGPEVSWQAVIAAALEVRARLAAAGLAAFVKTSGGKGLHVVAPLRPAARWTAAKAFSRGIAEAMAGDEPGRYVAKATKAARRGRIFVDYLRNGRGATAVAPYSPRARAGAPVSMPVAWEELSPDIGPAWFTVANAPTRLANLAGDPWADFRRAAAPLPAVSPSRRRR